MRVEFGRPIGYFQAPFGSGRPREFPLPPISANPKRATRSIAAPDVERDWYVADAGDRVLGRLATRVATILRGKHKPGFTPHVDGGDYVIVVNAGRVRLTGRKLDQKRYYRHTGYMGGIKSVGARRLLETRPERVVRAAVRGMLPKGPLGRQILRKLRVYAGAEHPHAAQKPQTLELDA